MSARITLEHFTHDFALTVRKEHIQSISKAPSGQFYVFLLHALRGTYRVFESSELHKIRHTMLLDRWSAQEKLRGL